MQHVVRCVTQQLNVMSNGGLFCCTADSNACGDSLRLLLHHMPRYLGVAPVRPPHIGAPVHSRQERTKYEEMKVKPCSYTSFMFTVAMKTSDSPAAAACVPR